MEKSKVISYTPEMLFKENLERGVKKELLLKVDNSSELIQGIILVNNNEDVGNVNEEIRLTEEETVLLLKIKACYDKVGTIHKVAKELNIQEWRVSKYLKRGHREKLFYFDKFSKKTRFLSKKISLELSSSNEQYYLSLEEKKSDTLNGEVSNDQTEYLSLPVDELPLSVRAINGLKDAGYNTLQDCLKLTLNEVLLLRNIGRKSAEEIVVVLEKAINSKIDTPQEKIKLLNEDYLIKILAIPLIEIRLSVRATNIINEIRGKHLIDLVKMSPEQIISLQNCGKSSLREINNFLISISLDFNMRLTIDLINKTKEYLSNKTNLEVLNELKNIYPDKYTLILEARKKGTPQRELTRYEECHRLYIEGGTLEYVGKKLNLTRERIRQMLEKGTKLGLFNYSGHEHIRLEKEKILNDYQEYLSLHKVAEINHVPVSYLRKMLTTYKVSHITLRELGITARKNKCIEEYQQIVSQLGHHPATTEMNTNPSWRALWARISRFWGNFDEFRKDQVICKPEHRIHPNTLIAFNKSKEKRVENKKLKIDQLLEYIRTHQPIASGDIKKELEVKSSTLDIYLNELMNQTKIQRVGAGSHVKYIFLHE